MCGPMQVVHAAYIPFFLFTYTTSPALDDVALGY
jgi:hypothetical protein